MFFSPLCYSKTLQVLRRNRRRWSQHGGAAGNGPTADLWQQLQRERVQDHHSQGRRKQDGGLRWGMLLNLSARCRDPDPQTTNKDVDDWTSQEQELNWGTEISSAHFLLLLSSERSGKLEQLRIWKLKQFNCNFPLFANVSQMSKFFIKNKRKGDMRH